MSDSLDSRQLKAFVVLARTGSFTETAKQLYLTHSAISHSMHALEDQVGCRLLSKLNKKVMLTEAGEALLHHAIRVLEEMGRARSALAELNQWGSRRLRLAVDPAFSPAFLTPILLDFHHDFPKVLLHVESCGTHDPVDLLKTSSVDVVLAEKPATDAAVEFLPLLDGQFQLVVNARHPLAQQKLVGQTTFGHHPCLLLRNSSQGRQQLDKFLAGQKLSLNLLGEMDSVEAIKDFVKRTSAMSFLPDWAVGTELKNGEFTTLAISRAPFRRTWGLLHSRARPLNHTESGWLKLCRKHTEKLG